jgi:hypothetical protein
MTNVIFITSGINDLRLLSDYKTFKKQFMKLQKVVGANLLFLLISTVAVKAQPAPIELAFGHKYGSVNFVFNKNFSQGSRFGFFHMNTVQFYYKDDSQNSFLLQDLIFVETMKNLRVATGVVYSKGGFNPTAGLQYIYSGKKFMVLIAPRINIESDPSYDVMTILQYKPELNDHIKLFTRVQMLNLFGSEGNIKSYQWFRLGLEIKGLQFGLVANMDEYGPNPSIETNFGLFIRKEIF